MASIKNAVVHFLGNQGKVNNIITACGNLGGALFNFLMNVLIQPKNGYGKDIIYTILQKIIRNTYILRLGW